MDYNNAPATKHKDILHILEIAKQRIKKEIEDNKKLKTGQEQKVGSFAQFNQLLF